jgi:hypothetical protein
VVKFSAAVSLIVFIGFAAIYEGDILNELLLVSLSYPVASVLAYYATRVCSPDEVSMATYGMNCVCGWMEAGAAVLSAALPSVWAVVLTTAHEVLCNNESDNVACNRLLHARNFFIVTAFAYGLVAVAHLIVVFLVLRACGASSPIHAERWRAERATELEEMTLRALNAITTDMEEGTASENEEDDNVTAATTTTASTEEMQCPKCGRKLRLPTFFCPRCRVNRVPTHSALPESNTTAT